MNLTIKKKATGKEMEKAKCKVMRPDFEVLTGGTEKGCLCARCSEGENSELIGDKLKFPREIKGRPSAVAP